MTAMPMPTLSFADRRRATAWVGILALLLALLAPQLSLESAEAAQTLTTQQEPCEEGFVRDAETGECEREPQRVPNQITTQCPEDTGREPATGACIPVSQPEPTVVDERPVDPTIDDVEVEPTSPSLPTGPTEVAAEPTVAPPLLGYVQAIKRACPDDFVPDETTTIAELQQACLDPIEGVLFSVLVGGAVHTTIPTDATGLSQLGSAPVGDVLLVEEIPSGYGKPIVYCADGYAFAPFEHTYSEEDRQEIVDGTGVAWTLVADTLLQCYFHNVAAQGPDGPGDLTTQNQAEGEAQAIALTNYKTRCPQGAPHPEFSPTELVELCTAAMEDVEFTFDDGHSAFAVTTDAQGVATWVNPPAGEVTIQETIPEGYGDPYVSCRAVPEDENGLGLWISFGQVPNGLLELEFGDPPESMECHWTNVLAEEPSGNTVSLGKWQCPQGIPQDETDLLFYAGSCTTAHDGVDFTLIHASGNHPATTVNDEVEWNGVPVGDLTIQEALPPGYTDPIVFCLTTSGAGGGDPKTDCTEATNGIDFQFGPSGGAAVAELPTTGDVIDGGVVFDDLEPDVYKATEAVPEGIAQVFVVECIGHIMGVLQPYPLSMGNVLDNIDLDAGEHLVCDWYNVPEVEGGELTVIKYICATETFVSEADCEIFEDGATFDLLYWTGTWDVVGTETTDGFGRIHWADLPDGEYWLDEQEGEWCHIASDELYEDGPWFLVLDNQETVVRAYNCDKDWTTTTIPEKYSNTGAAPDDSPTSGSERLPATPLLAGLVSTPLSRRWQQAG